MKITKLAIKERDEGFLGNNSYARRWFIDFGKWGFTEYISREGGGEERFDVDRYGGVKQLTYVWKLEKRPILIPYG